MPGRPKNSARKPCYCVTCNGALMSNRTFRRHLNKPQVSGNNLVVDATGACDDREMSEGTSGSDDSSSDLDRPTKKARTGRNSMDPVCFKLIPT